MPTTLSAKLAGTGLALTLLFAAPAAANQTDRFAAKTAERLAELQLTDDDVQSIRYVLKRNLSDRAGPDIIGAEAWIRLNQCSGYLVVQMNRAAFIRQTYTRGDCRIEGVPQF